MQVHKKTWACWWFLWIFGGWCGLGVVGMGCSDGNLVDPKDIGAIGSAGGFVRLDSGAFLQIPSFALDHGVLVELKGVPVSSIPSDWLALSAAISILPDKVVFGVQQYPMLYLPLELRSLPTQRNVLEIGIYQWIDNVWKPYPLYSLQEAYGFAVVWLKETGTYAAFLKPSS